jgi:hypothetical protein
MTGEGLFTSRCNNGCSAVPRVRRHKAQPLHHALCAFTEWWIGLKNTHFPRAIGQHDPLWIWHCEAFDQGIV